MATKKKTSAKRTTKEGRNLTNVEYRKLFDHVGKARVMALKMSEDKKYNARVRRVLRSVEQQLWKLGNIYPWSSITD